MRYLHSILKTPQKLLAEFFFYILSFLIVAFGQNAWIGPFSYFSSFLGYALFWGTFIRREKYGFVISFLWFAAVQAIQLSWFTSTTLQGVATLFVYALLIIGIGLQFAFLSYLIVRANLAKIINLLALASFWTLTEWGRIFILCGFTFNPVGLSLASNEISLQVASIAGVYGLTFLVIFTNLLGVKALCISKKLKDISIYLAVAIFPYLFGFLHENFWDATLKETKTLSAILVQPALLPQEKEFHAELKEQFISPLTQWNRIFHFIKEANHSANLIVLPEGSLPFGANLAIYPLESVEKIFGKASLQHFPPLQKPFAANFGGKWFVTNLFLAKTLSNLFNSDIILGLDDFDPISKCSYNAAFHLSPLSNNIERYEKRVLVPIGEYLPFSFLSKIAAEHGITDFFQKGKKAKIFKCKKIDVSPSICYEELFAHMIREGILLKASLLVNITNDVWYINSRLPIQHFENGKIRAVENGVPAIRVCNTSVTGAIDHLGRVVKIFEKKGQKTETLAGSLYVEIPLKSNPTLFSFWGNSFIISISTGFIVLCCVVSIKDYINRKFNRKYNFLVKNEI